VATAARTSSQQANSLLFPGHPILESSWCHSPCGIESPISNMLVATEGTTSTTGRNEEHAPPPCCIMRNKSDHFRASEVCPSGYPLPPRYWKATDKMIRCLVELCVPQHSCHTIELPNNYTDLTKSMAYARYRTKRRKKGGSQSRQSSDGPALRFYLHRVLTALYACSKSSNPYCCCLASASTLR